MTGPTSPDCAADNYRALLANVSLVADNLTEALQSADDVADVSALAALRFLTEAVQAAVLVLRGDDLPGEED